MTESEKEYTDMKKKKFGSIIEERERKRSRQTERETGKKEKKRNKKERIYRFEKKKKFGFIFRASGMD